MRTGMARSCIGDVITDRINYNTLDNATHILLSILLYLISRILNMYNSMYFRFPIYIRELIEKNL